MERKLFEILYKTEGDYWWFVGLRYLLENFLRKYYNSRKDLKLLDVGCGTGMNLKLLSKFGKVYGIDTSDDAINFCKIRGVKNVKKTNVMDIKFKASSFDVVTSLGVLYHKDVIDDVKAMKEIYRVLKPGGRFFIFDCAMKSLYGRHTVAFQGIRRYSKSELKSKLQKVNFSIEKISYANTLLFPLVYIGRKSGEFVNLEPKSEVQAEFNPFFNYILKIVYKTELKGLEYFNYPYGINIFAIARKPNKS